MHAKYLVEVDVLTTVKAAALLGTTPPTVRSLLEKKALRGQCVPRGKRSVWAIDRVSVETYLAEHGRYDDRRRHPGNGRLQQLEEDVAHLKDLVLRGSHDGFDSVRELARERDDLRATVVNLEDALARTRAVADLQHDADAERAAVIEHLLAAMAAGDRADALSRQVITQLQGAVAGFTLPGHAGSVSGQR